MLFGLLSRPRARRTGATSLRRPVHSFRPTVETLEAREVLASPASLGPPALGAALVGQASPTQSLASLLGISIPSVTAQGAQLVAHGRFANQPFDAPITVTASPNAADPTCPILHLRIDAIHLNVLGLHVDTSNICLDITAHQGGGLLGDLLCGVSNLLNNGNTLGQALGTLSQTDLNTLLSGLTGALNGTFDALNGTAALSGDGGHHHRQNGTCDILNLSLGPVDLNLLGLEVHLDNCANGPVTVDVTGQTGPGNLLGNLLCGVAGLLDGPANGHALANAINRVENFLDRLI